MDAFELVADIRRLGLVARKPAPEMANDGFDLGIRTGAIGAGSGGAVGRSSSGSGVRGPNWFACQQNIALVKDTGR